jgi:hypothetical protein
MTVSHRRISGLVLAAGLLLAVATWLSAQEPSPNAADHDFAKVRVIVPVGSGPIVGSADLVRNNNGITCVIHTSGLVPGDAYSVWWVIPEDGMLVFNATGGIAGGDGTASFAGHASTGPIGPVDNSVVLSNGDGSFDQPRGDTITVIIRHHGSPIPGMINEQTGTFNGGCSLKPAGTCKNVQKATFTPDAL